MKHFTALMKNVLGQIEMTCIDGNHGGGGGEGGGGRGRGRGRGHDGDGVRIFHSWAVTEISP